MRFHKYISHRDRFVDELRGRIPPGEDLKAWINANGADDAYAFAIRQCQHAMDQIKRPQDSAERENLTKTIGLLIAEEQWFRDERPFYNVWPIMFSVVRTLKLDIPWNKVRFPFYTMMFQFPEGNEPFGLGVAMVATSQGGKDGASYEQTLTIEGYHVGDRAHYVTSRLIPDNRVTINESFLGGNVGDEETVARGEVLQFLLRLACVVSLLADGEDLITPILLRRDADRAGDVPPDVLQEWIARKAEKARQLGHYGFDVGRDLNRTASVSPTAVGPYFAVRWTGQGRSVAKVVLVREHLKNLIPLNQVPTGFLGWESEEELLRVINCVEELHTVYFLRDGDRPYVKIGFTAGSLAKRLRGLATANRYLMLLGYIATADGRRKESEIHRELHHTIRDGEFFYVSDDHCRDLILRHGGTWLENSRNPPANEN